MIKPSIPANEAERLNALVSYDLLDTTEEQLYDNLTKLAAEICSAKISLISLIDANRQWFKSRCGLDATETPRDLAFCAHAICMRQDLIVEDARLDQRFHDNPLVVGEPHVIFYAGIPLIDSAGYALGTLCVIDDHPKKLSTQQIAGLKTLAQQVVANFELRRELKEKHTKQITIERLSKQVPGVIYQYQMFTDGRSCFPFATEGLEQIYEVKPDQVKDDAKIVLSRLLPEDAEMIISSVKKSMNDLSDWKLEYRVQLPTKGLRWLRGFARPERLPDQSVLWHGFISDITEEKELEKIVELQRDQMMYSAKLAALGEMAAGVAHEINNPLAIISAKTNFLARQLEKGLFDVSKFKSDLDKIDQTTHRIAKIIRGLRHFSRDGAYDPMEVCSLKDIVEEAVEMSQERFHNYQIDVKLNIPKECVIECRRVQVSQVFVNLLNNSFDAIYEEPERWIKINAHVAENKIYLQFIDSGNGIPKNISDKMMNPFFTTKEVGRGTGLGLSISRGIISRHQGELKYDEQSKKTCFEIQLPLAKIQSNSVAS